MFGNIISTTLKLAQITYSSAIFPFPVAITFLLSPSPPPTGTLFLYTCTTYFVSLVIYGDDHSLRY